METDGEILNIEHLVPEQVMTDEMKLQDRKWKADFAKADVDGDREEQEQSFIAPAASRDCSGLVPLMVTPEDREVLEALLQTNKEILVRTSVVNSGDTLEDVSSKEFEKRDNERPTLLDHDTFSFMIVAPVRSIPFLLSMLVLVFKTIVLTLIAADMIDTGDAVPLSIPVMVAIEVQIAQFFAVCIAVFSQNDLITSFKLWYIGFPEDSLKKEFGDGVSYSKWAISVFFLFADGCFSLIVTLLLIITTDEVVDLLLNFTAIEFVAALDELGFELSMQGFLGWTNQFLAERIRAFEFEMGSERKFTPYKKLSALLMILLCLLASWAVVLRGQNIGYYHAKNIYVQFDGSLRSDLAGYSGVYTLDIRTGESGYNRIRYISNKETNNGFFSYCQDSEVWAFGMSEKSCENMLAHSESTSTFDLAATSESNWYVIENDSPRAFEMEHIYLSAGCDSDEDCRGHQGGGECVESRCKCGEGFYGLLCDYQENMTCTHLSVQDPETPFIGSRTYASNYTLLLQPGESNRIIKIYDRPVYVGFADEKEKIIDVILFEGLHWILIDADTGFKDLKNHTVAGLAEYLFNFDGDFFATESIQNVRFQSEQILFNTPLDAKHASPEGLTWTEIKHVENGTLSNIEISGDSTTILLCSKCHNVTNQCQYENICNDNSTCECTNGATGMLCQNTPLANGYCNPYFNTPLFLHDGGDCCESTCISTDEHICGVLTDEWLDYVDVGFPNCTGGIARCAGTECWIETSDAIRTDSTGQSAKVMLASNSKTLVIAQPEIELIRVYDQIDSRWEQRGSLIEGELASLFGIHLAVATLPGEVINRRYGKLFMTIAATFSDDDAFWASIYIWQSNAFEWEKIGTFEIARSAAEVEKIEIGFHDKTASLLTVLTNGTLTMYESQFSGETGLVQPILKTIQVGGCVSLAGDGGFIAYNEGSILYVYNRTNQDFTLAAQFDLLNNTYNLFQSFDTANITSLKLSSDGQLLSTSIQTTREEDDPVFVISIFKICHTCTSESLVGALIPKISSEVNTNPTDVQNTVFSDDAETVALLVQNEESPEILVYTSGFEDSNDDEPNTDSNNKRGFEQVGIPLRIEDENWFALSEQGPIIAVSEKGFVRNYSPPKSCGDDELEFRLSLSLDENPDEVDWSLVTLITLGSFDFLSIIDESCDGCYAPRESYGRTRVTEIICIPEDQKDCLEFSFENRKGLSDGAGFSIFLDGTELDRFSNNYDREGGETVESKRVFKFDNQKSTQCLREIQMCDEGYSNLAVVILLDDYPEDTALNLRDMKNNNSNFSMTIPKGGFTSVSEFRILQECVPTDGCYEFSIIDEDGICCEDGFGYYSILFDELIVNGTDATIGISSTTGIFTDRVVHVFGGGCDSNVSS